MGTELTRKALMLNDIDFEGLLGAEDADLIRQVVTEAAFETLTRTDRIADLAQAIAQELARGLGQPLQSLGHLDPGRIAQVIDGSQVS